MLARLLALALLACGAAALRPAIPARPASAVRSRAAAVCMADPPPKGKGYKTVYDDESPPPPRKDPLSNNMRDRLLREQQGLGSDPNSKNPFLAVFGFVGVFVLLGALAVNFGPPAGGPFGP